MSTGDQLPFTQPEFASNPEQRCPCVLLLDTSASMQGRPISEVNQGLIVLKDELMADPVATLRVEIAAITFGPVQVLNDFQTADLWAPPQLRANGDTPMGAAIEQAIQLVESRKQVYKSNGVSYYRPWIFLLTDGGPTDQWQNAAAQVHEGDNDQRKAFSFFAVGVEGANFDILKQICVREPLKLQGLRFRDLFRWLSASLSSVSRSIPGDAVPLQNPAVPGGWASA